jgi:LacI family transcriptional regulator
MRKANIEDVATLAGVSIKTVSRVINKEPNVRESTRERVLKAAKELKYRPNPSARSLAGRRSHLIGLLYDDPGLYENPSSNYIVNIQQGALRVCKAEDDDLLIHPCNYKSRNLNREIKSMIEHSRVDGLIVTPPLSDKKSLIETIKKTGTPVVAISPGNAADGLVAVSTNDREVCAEMTAYLASIGHKRIAFIEGNPDHKAIKDRYLGYKDGLGNAGLAFSKTLVKEGDNSPRTGEECAKKLLRGKNPPTAIFAANDDMAAGVLRAAHRMGIDVPSDLSVVGFDDIPLARQIYPALTTIRQPIRKMAETATEILMEQIRSQPHTSTSPVVEAELRIRESSGPA